jgi:hypothetical protein
MNRFIFGFQRRVWCPKWTPASNSSFIVTSTKPGLLRLQRLPGVAVPDSRVGRFAVVVARAPPGINAC